MTAIETTLGHVSNPGAARSVAVRSKGHRQGPVIRLISPGDLGELVKPFVFLGYFAVRTGRLHTAGTVLHTEVAVLEDGSTPIELRAEGDTEFVIGSATRHAHPPVLGPSSVHTSTDALRQGHEQISRLAGTPIVQAARAR